MFISIDLGQHNLGWTTMRVVDSKRVFESGLFDLNVKSKRGQSIVVARVRALNSFIRSLIDEPLQGAVIEEQVQRNQVCMYLMYSLASILSTYTDRIAIFSPELKFTHVGIPYSTKNKEHKRLSVQMAISAATALEARGTLTAIESVTKKDDIADSFNQLIVQLDLWGEDIEAKTLYKL